MTGLCTAFPFQKLLCTIGATSLGVAIGFHYNVSASSLMIEYILYDIFLVLVTLLMVNLLLARSFMKPRSPFRICFRPYLKKISLSTRC